MARPGRAVGFDNVLPGVCLLQTRLFQMAFAVLCFKFIVHCPYVAVEAALLRLMDSLATNGELSGAHRDVSLPLCVYRAAFPFVR